ncbi:MAG: tyrosine-type recombinase/integrase, partial [Chloroflexi bacterium]|nr:tyrosine-type recombinase/integrase [Chloroflexota bacterium]
MSATKRDQLIRLLPRDALGSQIAAFLTDRQARGLSPRTVQFYGDELRHFREWAQGQRVTDAQAVTADLIRRYLLYLGQRRNPGGVHAAYRTLRAFLRWYGEEVEPDGWQDPMRRVRPPKLPQEPLEPVPLPDVQAMLRTCERKTFAGDRDRALLLALLDTGLRASEFVALDLGDVNLTTGAALVRSGKGGKSRTV